MIPEGNRSKGVAYTNDSLETRVRFLLGILVLTNYKKIDREVTLNRRALHGKLARSVCYFKYGMIRNEFHRDF